MNEIESESMEVLSDPLPRLYSCFCGKYFTTYPGIYLHLKSKHAPQFPVYKQLKITKLFKKIINQYGKQVYLLEKVQSHPQSGQPVKQKQKRKRQHQINRSIATVSQKLPEQSNLPPQYPNMGLPFEHYQHLQHLQQLQNMSDISASSMSHFGPSMFDFRYPQMRRPQVTTKQLMEQYLYEFQRLQPGPRLVLYHLMNHIDNNYQRLNDPRAGLGLFLSYCFEFGPQLAKPLFKQYIEMANKEFSEMEILLQFVHWLAINMYIEMPGDIAPDFSREFLFASSRNALDHRARYMLAQVYPCLQHIFPLQKVPNQVIEIIDINQDKAGEKYKQHKDDSQENDDFVIRLDKGEINPEQNQFNMQPVHLIPKLADSSSEQEDHDHNCQCCQHEQQSQHQNQIEPNEQACS